MNIGVIVTSYWLVCYCRPFCRCSGWLRIVSLAECRRKLLCSTIDYGNMLNLTSGTDKVTAFSIFFFLFLLLTRSTNVVLMVVVHTFHISFITHDLLFLSSEVWDFLTGLFLLYKLFGTKSLYCFYFTTDFAVNL